MTGDDREGTAVPTTPQEPGGEGLRIRTAQADRDLPAIIRLFEAGLRAGDWMDNDTGADVHNFHEAYCADEGRSQFWVAELAEALADARVAALIVGMVGVQCEDVHTAVIRRLRVEPEHQRRGIGTRLIEQALAFCREQGYLKVVLDARVTQERAITLFERFSFQLNRTRNVRGERILDFYLDLYRDHDPDRNGNGGKRRK